MAEVIVTAIVSVFFVIGVYTTVREIWALITGDCDEQEEKPP